MGLMSSSSFLWISIGYLCGSIPFAWLLGRVKGIDIRTVGSRNVGATNLGRALGRRWGICCFLLDLFKGFMPVFLAGTLWGGQPPGGVIPTTSQAWWWLGVGLAAIMGHMFPVWLGFKGGKGVATGLGVMLGYWPIMTIPTSIGVVIWVTIVLSTKYVGLASVVAAVSIPVVLGLRMLLVDGQSEDHLPFLAVTILIAAMVTVRHRSNLTRLCRGTEPKLGSPPINL